MNTYRVLQRKDGRFDFTCENGSHIWPVGYCAPYKEWWLDNRIPSSPVQIAEYKATAHKHHGDGHATEEEAAACYAEWLLDHRLLLGQEHISEQRPCVVCGKWSNLTASVDISIWWLCQEHCNREECEKLLHISPDTVIYSSW